MREFSILVFPYAKLRRCSSFSCGVGTFFLASSRSSCRRSVINSPLAQGFYGHGSEEEQGCGIPPFERRERWGTRPEDFGRLKGANAARRSHCVRSASVSALSKATSLSFLKSSAEGCTSKSSLIPTPSNSVPSESIDAWQQSRFHTVVLRDGVKIL